MGAVLLPGQMQPPQQQVSDGNIIACTDQGRRSRSSSK